MDFNFFVRELASSENLYWAWEKVRRQIKSDSAWSNQLDIAAFELNLRSNLHGIGSHFLNGTYQTGPLRPLGQPKKNVGLTRAN